MTLFWSRLVNRLPQPPRVVVARLGGVTMRFERLKQCQDINGTWTVRQIREVREDRTVWQRTVGPWSKFAKVGTLKPGLTPDDIRAGMARGGWEEGR